MWNLMIILLFVLIGVILSVILIRKNKIITAQKNEIELYQKQTAQIRQTEQIQKEQQNRIWQSVNTISLYANLSKEEGKNQSLIEKQEEILCACEEIFYILKQK